MSFPNERLSRSLTRLRPHGTRTRSQQGCKCFPCRLASSAYERRRTADHRAGIPANKLVPIATAQAHLLMLKRTGVGFRVTAEFSGVHRNILIRIRTGKQRYLSQANERRILEVTPDVQVDNSLIPADKTKVMVQMLLEEGFTKREIGKRLGLKYGIQVARKGYVMAKTEKKIERFYNRVMAEVA